MAGKTKDAEKRVVMIAMDGSKHSAYAFKWYAENLHRKTDEVVVTHCPERVELPPTTIIDATESTIAELYQSNEEKTKEVAKQINDMARNYKIQHRLEHLHGYAGHSIVQSAEENKAGMIICGSRGQGIIRRTILGSISDYILHHARMPVIICKHEDEQKRLKLWPFS